jgi:hypothetical protein
MRSSVGSSARVCGYCRDRRRSRQPIPRDQRGQFTRNYGRHRLDLERCRTDGAFVLAAAGKGAISADRRGPRRQCSVAATGHRVRWNWFQREDTD